MSEQDQGPSSQGRLRLRTTRLGDGDMDGEGRGSLSSLHGTDTHQRLQAYSQQTESRTEQAIPIHLIMR